MGMRIMVLAVLVLVVGCAAQEPSAQRDAIAGPPAADVERALVVSWDPYMQAETRPQVTWFDNTACGMTRVVANATMQHAARCDEVWFNSNGTISVGWHKGERISDTGLGLGLAQWKSWLWTTSVADTTLINETRVAYDAQIAGANL